MDLEEGLKKEWLLTNGLGGYSYSTACGCNTRKYHGLLVAPLSPPAQRYVILSKLDEAIQIGDKEHILYSNMCSNYIADGYQYLVKFEKHFLPIFSYQVEDISIKKIVCMEYGKNTVCVYYKVKNGKKPVTLKLAPIVNFRDFHTMKTDHIFHLQQTIENRKVKVIVDQHIQTPIYMYMSDGTYTQHHEDTFYHMFYREEEKRGFYPEENLAVTGIYEIEVLPNEEKDIFFICSLESNIEEKNVKNVINQEIIRLNEDIIQSQLINVKAETTNEKDVQFRKLIEQYCIATDNFIVYRPLFQLHTILAGYPWFLDWGRDSMIAFEGLLLIPRRYQIAKEVLLTFVRDIQFGLVPNGYSGFDNRPLYNSVDASLLLFEQVEKYIRYTSDEKFIKENIYQKLKEIIHSYCKGINLDNNNIYLDTDYLIVSGTEKTQNTWMDAQCDNVPVTPRNGKAVEVNALWYNALKILEKLAMKFEGHKVAEGYRKMATQTKESFCKKFYHKRRKCLYDVLGDSKIRPNQLFSLSLTYPVIDGETEEAWNILHIAEKKLLNAYGLKTLAKGEKDYVEVYEGDCYQRDKSYHQGITWPWLLGLYYDSLKNCIKSTKDKDRKKELENKLNQLVKTTKKTYISSFLDEGIVGSISELYDSKKPYFPKGALAQAWSVAEVFRIILEK